MSFKKFILSHMSLPAEENAAGTEERLRNANKNLLKSALQQPRRSRFSATWLFSNHTHTFHQSEIVHPSVFDNCLAIRSGFTRLLQTSSSSSSGVSGIQHGEGQNLFLLPVQYSKGFLVGYSFGGLTECQTRDDEKPYRLRVKTFLPHFIGRFSYNVTDNDLLIIVHGITQEMSGIWRVKQGRGYDRAWSTILIPNNSYSYSNLPGSVLSIISGKEQKLDSLPRYQFSVVGMMSGTSGDSCNETVTDSMDTLVQGLARLERMLKGKYYCSKLIKDEMDHDNGEILNRCTLQVESEYDSRGAAGCRVFKEIAVQKYYSYMSRVSSSSSSKQRVL